MHETLKSLHTAATEANWSLVNRYLQRIVSSYKGSNRQTNKDNLGHELEFEQILDFALQVLRFGDFQERWEVAKIFPVFGDRVVPCLLNILENEGEDLESRWFAIRILGKFDQPAVIISLAKVLRDTEEEDLCAIAATALANIGTPAIKVLSELLQDEKARLLAVQSLAIIRRVEIIDPLRSVVTDGNPEVRATSLEALGSFHNLELIPLFIAGLKDVSALVRKEAVVALGMCSEFKADFDIVSYLQPLLHDLDPQVCQQAVLALGRMEDEQATEALFLVLMSALTPTWLQEEVVRVLNWGNRPQSLAYLEKALYSSQASLCKEIITVLGRQDSSEKCSEATQILIDFFNSKQDLVSQSPIKQAIAVSLGELGNPSAISILQTLTSDKDSRVKLHAIASLKKIPQN
ncbi:hypothetical protein BC008_03910 [Mastigocoleus testarum BC008]|uniref:PBS lyase n=2 Tax=Mastigocoleus TaxID=996924 RepID=A0A0V7ZYF0_9CYAN|nr:hypothetical protein BC008_03730 [Mastigocoleus testarum BC008]KST69343.1 hypothetical protein BC008_03910 [Mastigocoleus testarum BC008]